MHVERRDSNAGKVYKPFRQYLGDVECTLNQMKVIFFKFSFFLILPSLHSTFYSLDYKINIKVGFILDNRPLLSPFPLL
jgi:membrane-anchored glycerophosphoryl diester phosphodiesterase (GDPDase)